MERWGRPSTHVPLTNPDLNYISGSSFDSGGSPYTFSFTGGAGTAPSFGVVLAGYSYNFFRQLNYRVLIASSTPTSCVIRLEVGSGFTITLLRVYVVTLEPNDHIWMMEKCTMGHKIDHTCSTINSFSGGGSESVSVPSPIAIINPSEFEVLGLLKGFDLEQQARKQIYIRIIYVDISGGNVNFDVVVSDVENLARWVDFMVLLVNKTTINVANYAHYIS